MLQSLQSKCIKRRPHWLRDTGGSGEGDLVGSDSGIGGGCTGGTGGSSVNAALGCCPADEFWLGLWAFHAVLHGTSTC